ncbi:MAG: DUF2306 domain-containing protein [Vicinamibacterales bacterium]
MGLSAIGTVHTLAASLSLLTGAIQLIRTRRDTLHRRVGYVYAGAMGVNNMSALTIYEFTGGFNIFHALALYSLFNVGMALRPMLVTPRPYQWLRIHYLWVAWSYLGLSAAALTEFLVRVVGLPGWAGAGAATPPVFLVGGWLILRFAPRRRPVV